MSLGFKLSPNSTNEVTKKIEIKVKNEVKAKRNVEYIIEMMFYATQK